MCRGKQNREDAKRGWKIDGWEVEIWETVRRIAKLDLRMRKKMLNRRAKRGENHIWCKDDVVVTENGMVWSQGRKKDQKVWEWPVLSMVVIMEGWRRIKRAEGWLFFVSLYFLLGVSRFGCGLRASKSMWVSIARLLSSISDNLHDGVIDQWDGRWRKQSRNAPKQEGKRVVDCKAINIFATNIKKCTLLFINI